MLSITNRLNLMGSVCRLAAAGVVIVLSAALLDGQTPGETMGSPNNHPPISGVPAEWQSGRLGAPNDSVDRLRTGATGLGARNPAVSQASAVAPMATDSSHFTGKTSPIARVAAAGDVIGFTNSDGSGSQTITLVHTGKSWMAVYHIDRSGTIQLVSSRPIDADFALQLNATSPLPDSIRQMGKR